MHHLKVGLVMVVATLLPFATHASSSCVSLLKFSAPDTAITAAKHVAAGMIIVPSGEGPPVSLQAPAHCRVDGMIGAHTGADGTRYGIRFAVAMPDQWNGRLLYQGGGGLNGSVQPPVGLTAAGTEPALARGFAVVSSDSGHEG